MSNTGDDTLNLVLNADGSGAVSGISSVEDRLSALEQAYIRSSAAADSATGALNRHKTAATGLSAGLKDTGDASLKLARGFQVVGLEADAAAAKLVGLGEVLETIEKAAPEILLIGAALAAASAGFNFFKDGISEAAAFQVSMTSLSTAVKLSGGDWDKTKESVEGYLEVQERATGFDSNQVLSAIDKLVVAGASYRDAQTQVSIAEDVSRATGESLEEVINKIIEAEAGRAQGLARLDPRLRDLIKSHADLFTIMQQLEHDMGGQAAAAADTYTGSVDRLYSAWDTFKKDIGTWLLPWLTDIVNGFIGLGDEIQDVVKDIQHLDAIKFVKDELTLDFADPSARGRKIANDAQWERQHQLERGLARGTFDNNPTMGNEGSGSSDVPSITRPETDDSAYGDPRKTDVATQMMKAFAQVEADLQSKVDAATSSTEKQAATLALVAAKANDAKAEEAALAAIIAQDLAAKTAQNAATLASYDAYKKAVDGLNAYKQSLAGTKETEDAKKHEQDLQQAVDDLKSKWDTAKKSLDDLNSTLKTHQTLLDDTQKSAQKAADEQTKADNAMALADADYYAKAAEQQAEFMATFGKTNAQKVLIYRQMTAAITGEDEASDERRRELTSKATEAWQAALDDQAKAYKQWVDEATKETSTLIDDIVLKHQTLKDELSNIYNEILKSYVDMVSKMIAQNLAAGGLGGLGKLFGAPAAPGSNPLLSGSASPSSRNGSTASSAIYVTMADAESTFLSKTTGNTTGVQTGSAMATLNSTPATTGTGSGSSSSSSGLSGLATALSSALKGAAVGSATSGVTGLDSEDSEIGGAIGSLGTSLLSGGAKAFMTANPLVGLGVDALTSIIGGLLGPHETAADQPDLNDPTWATDATDWQGQAGQYGANYVQPGAQYNTSNGGISESEDIAAWVQENQNNVSSLTVAQQGIYQQMLALMGGNPNASAGQIGIADQGQGMITLTDGTKLSVTSFEQMVSNFNSTVGSVAAGAPIYSIGRSYPDFNAGVLQNTGTTTPPNGGTSTNVNGTTVIINNPTIVGPNGLETVAVSIGQAINRSANGVIIGSPNVYQGTQPYLRNAALGLA